MEPFPWGKRVGDVAAEEWASSRRAPSRPPPAPGGGRSFFLKPSPAKRGRVWVGARRGLSAPPPSRRYFRKPAFAISDLCWSSADVSQVWNSLPVRKRVLKAPLAMKSFQSSVSRTLLKRST